MNEELEFILDRVHRNEDERTDYLNKAEQWEKMYRLDAGFNRTLVQAIAEGQEQVILPTPRNVVNLSQRLLSSTPRIDVLPQDPGDRESVDYAEQCERWLTAMWKQINLDQQRNVTGAATWQALVWGRFAFEVKWIKDQLPPLIRKKHLPFSIRTLDPRNVGLVRGPYCTEFAYHKYEMSVWEVLRMWPDLRDAAPDSQFGKILEQLTRNHNRHEDQMVCVIDYWDTDPHTGHVSNAVLVEDEFAKPYAETSYPYVPIIVGMGDYAVGLGDEFDGLSILDTIDGLWQFECRLASMMATALLWHFWPAITVSNESGQPIDDIDISPGSTTVVPWGTKIEMHRIEPNVPLSQVMMDQIEGFMQQSTYPAQMYGATSDSITSGYQASLMSETAMGRIKNFKEGLEMAMGHVNALVLCLVEKMGGKKGVTISGYDEREGEKYALTISKEMIKGNYQNEVRITPAIPQDDIQKLVQGKQLADGKYISAQTLLDKFLGVQVPSDETRRIALEELMQSDEMRPFRLRTAATEYFKEDALDMLFETPFMPPPPEGMEWTRNDQGRVILQPVQSQPAPLEQPIGAAAGLPPMSGPPLGAPPAGPMGLPPSGPPIQPDATLAGPMGGGIPPVLQGQLEGEALGLPQDVDPLLLDAMLNTPASPDEQLNMAAGLPPDGVI